MDDWLMKIMPMHSVFNNPTFFCCQVVSALIVLWVQPGDRRRKQKLTLPALGCVVFSLLTCYSAYNLVKDILVAKTNGYGVAFTAFSFVITLVTWKTLLVSARNEKHKE